MTECYFLISRLTVWSKVLSPHHDRSCCVAQADLKLMFLFPQPPCAEVTEMCYHTWLCSYRQLQIMHTLLICGPL